MDVCVQVMWRFSAEHPFGEQKSRRREEQSWTRHGKKIPIPEMQIPSVCPRTQRLWNRTTQFIQWLLLLRLSVLCNCTFDQHVDCTWGVSAHCFNTRWLFRVMGAIYRVTVCFYFYVHQGTTLLPHAAHISCCSNQHVVFLQTWLLV